MAVNYAVLGQSNPAADTNTDLYTVPSSTQAIISTITVAQLAAGYSAYRIAVRPGGATLANAHYLAYGVEVYEKTAQTITIGLTLDAGDVVTVRADSANVAFGIYGSEVTP
jgi:hypothetical protein